jgi:hypothetical protein
MRLDLSTGTLQNLQQMQRGLWIRHPTLPKRAQKATSDELDARCGLNHELLRPTDSSADFTRVPLCSRTPKD